MARTKVTETPKPEAPPPVTLLRVEERTERVDLDDAKKVERMAIAAGMLHTANSLYEEASEYAEEARNKKKSADAKRAEGERVLFDAQNGQALQPYPVIIERHPTRPAEMIVWRVPDGMAAAELLELEPCENPRDEAEHFAAREAQGCTLLENRAMTPDELEVARAQDQQRLPFPEGGETMGSGSESSTDEEGAQEDGDEDADDGNVEEGSVEEGDADEDAAGSPEADTAPADGEVEGNDAPGEDGAGSESTPVKKTKAANPNVIARVRIALNGLVAGSAYAMPELAERTGHHADDIKPALVQLIEEGFAAKSGTGRGTKYGRAVVAVQEPAPAVAEQDPVRDFVDL